MACQCLFVYARGVTCDVASVEGVCLLVYPWQYWSLSFTFSRETSCNAIMRVCLCMPMYALPCNTVKRRVT